MRLQKNSNRTLRAGTKNNIRIDLKLAYVKQYETCIISEICVLVTWALGQSRSMAACTLWCWWAPGTRGEESHPSASYEAIECTEPLGADGHWWALVGVAVPARGNDRLEVLQAFW